MEWISVDNYLPPIPKRRDGTSLISNDILMKDENEDIIDGYYHFLYGFMT